MTAARSRIKPVILGVATLAALLLAADAGAWFWATGRMVQLLQAWEAAELDFGLHVMHAPPVRTGWPFAAELMLPQVTAAAESPRTADILSWQAERVTLRLSPLHPGLLMIVPSGAQRITGAGMPPLPLSATRLEARISLSSTEGRVDGAGLRFALPDGPLGIAQVAIRFDAAHATAAVEGITLPIGNLPFGGSIASASVEGSVTVPVPPAPDLGSAVAAWRDAGGKLVLDHGSIHWGPLDAEGSGTLAFDAALQPVATASLHLTGYDSLIESLARAGAITANDARVAATLLGLLAHHPTGAPAFVDVPLTLQDGRLSAGAIPIAKIARLPLP